MGIKSNIKKWLFLLVWSFMAAGTVVLLAAAMKSRNGKVCNGFTIDRKGEANSIWFFDKKEITSLITRNGIEKIRDQPLHSFDLRKMEGRLKKNVWIRDAQLFFDSRNILHVKVEERIPVARIFTNSGYSFYIDTAMVKLPLSAKFFLRLPVFTGYPSEKISRLQDSALICQVKQFSWYVLNRPFWMAQVAQVNINTKCEFEIIPTIGNQVILFGDGTNLEKKFRKLLCFYQQVLAKTGFEKYTLINIQYEGQVIGVKKEKSSPQNELRKIVPLKQLNTIQ